MSAEPYFLEADDNFVTDNHRSGHKLFRQYSESAKLTQNTYRLLIGSKPQRYSIESVASILGCSYLSAYRACRKLIKLGLASREFINWPTKKKPTHRVGVRYQEWHQVRLPKDKCPVELSFEL